MSIRKGIETPTPRYVEAANDRADLSGLKETWSYFVLAVLGFSFWFLLAVPFASHRESYEWLTIALRESAGQQFRFGPSATYRPLPQIVIWWLFRLLDPSVFPTSALRQALLQGMVYGCFLVAWWLIYSATPQRRVFACVACVTGAVMFTGYVHLFHIYGLMYVPPALTLGIVLHFNVAGLSLRQQAWFAGIAMVLALWHPFATTIFVSYYFGFYLDTFQRRTTREHVLSAAVLLLGTLVLAAAVVIFPRTHTPLDTRLSGFLACYRTTEINLAVSFVAFLLSQIVMMSVTVSAGTKLIGSLLSAALCVACLLSGIPLLLVWVLLCLMKSIHLRSWRLFFLLLAAAMFPFGGSTGTPIYALFALIVAVYVTALGWLTAEKALSLLRPRLVVGVIATAALVVLMVRAGADVPVVTRLAAPLLAERERTYQLETVLAWLHASPYCHYQIAFADDAPSPVDSLTSALTRRNRPPAAIGDVLKFWDGVLRCHQTQAGNSDSDTAIITFDRRMPGNAKPVFDVHGRYAGDAAVWIGNLPH